MLALRSAQWPDDEARLAALDTYFTTETISVLAREEFAFRLVEKPVSPPLRKRDALLASDPEERIPWDDAVVAEVEGELAGFAAAQYVAWYRRVVIRHLYVASSCRRRGVGTRLLAALDTFAPSAGARCLWLETQEETALFFARPVPAVKTPASK